MSFLLEKMLALEKQGDTRISTTRRTIILLIIIPIGISAVGIGWYFLQPKSRRNEAVLAPDFSLNDVEGNNFRLSDFRGKVVVLDFMATWCGGCRAEMPHLGDIWERKDYRDSLVLVSIDIDPRESVEALRYFAQEFQYATWIWARDTANLVQAYEVVYIPKIVVIDMDGYIMFTHDKVTGTSVLISEIDELLS